MRDLPKEIGPYTIIERIGRGGMGVVYRARTQSGEVVALKVMREDLAQNFSFVRRFQREARIAEGLDSPHIVRVLDSGGEEETRYITMEYVQGQTLAEVLREEGAIAPDEATDIAKQVAKGLAVAHRKDVIHRDISPQNIMLTAEGAVKIADFGIARASGFTTLTATGMFMGKPTYAAPETVRGEADIRSDIYALGIVMFEMVAGRAPFAAPTPIAVMEKQTRDPPPALANLGVSVPAYYEEIIQRCLRKDADERYQTPEELVTALEAKDVSATIAGATRAGARETAKDADTVLASEPTQLAQPPAGTTPSVAEQPEAAAATPTGAGVAPPGGPAAPAATGGGRFPLVLWALLGALGVGLVIAGLFALDVIPIGDGDGKVGGDNPTEAAEPTATPRATATSGPPATPTLPPVVATVPGPVPRLLSISVPQEANAGETITISVRARNEGEDAESGSISVSMPDDPVPVEVPGELTVVEPGTDGMVSYYTDDNCDSERRPASYLLVERFWPESDGWPAGDTREISFRVRVPNVEVMEVRIRVSMAEDDGVPAAEADSTCIRTHPHESQTSERDQQNYPVIERRVIVR